MKLNKSKEITVYLIYKKITIKRPGTRFTMKTSKKLYLNFIFKPRVITTTFCTILANSKENHFVSSFREFGH